MLFWCHYKGALFSWPRQDVQVKGTDPRRHTGWSLQGASESRTGRQQAPSDRAIPRPRKPESYTGRLYPWPLAGWRRHVKGFQ